jgi:phosphomannomutase/phosphoglucomutase
MQLNPTIFREYDIRGTVDRDLSVDFARLLGRAFALYAKEHGRNNLAIGYDCRHSSEPYARAISEGIASEGLDCCLTGMGPTPQLYYSLHKRNYGGGIQVTGSHNPPDMNGFKLCLGTDSVYGDQIQRIYSIAADIISKPASAAKPGEISHNDIRREYTEELIANCLPHMGQRKLKVVVDSGNGVGGLVGPAVLRALGLEVIELYCEPDGSFPNHHPDPTVMEYIVDLCKKVQETGADFGIGFDGDADRMGIVDENSEVIFADMLLAIMARDVLREVPGATIIGDVKCSSRLFNDIEAHGGKAIMWKTGHSLMKAKLKESGGALAGELSGHIAYKHRFFGFDDAIYSVCRFVEIVSRSKLPVSQLAADLPKMVATPEIRIDCPEEHKFLIAEKAKTAFPGYKVNPIDGVRVEFDHGWGLVRASNTQPILVLRFEADSEALLTEYRSLVIGRIEEIKKSL